MTRIGDTLGRYRLVEEVGQGGMAVVYRGEDTLLGREVAVKLLHPHLAGLPESRARLEREAQAVAKLRHDNILEIFDYSPPESSDRYLVTEFIHGETLTEFHRHHPIRFPEVAELIVAEVTGALEHAHLLGVIHRDVKPENVMIRRDGIVKLTDFGIAQIVDKEKLTVTGQLLGSPAYMSPEHVEGGRIDFRTDVFAAGILLYQLATGELPFKGKNPHEVLKKIAECRYMPPEQVNLRVGGRLARTIKRALARLPDERFQDVAAMRRELLADLEDVGLTDVRGELRAFFADPNAWEEAWKGRLVSALAERGRTLAAEGRTAAALAAWSRALTVAPDDPTVRALVDGIAGRQKRKRVALLGLAGIAATGGVLVGLRLLTPAATGPDAGTPDAFGAPFASSSESTAAGARSSSESLAGGVPFRVAAPVDPGATPGQRQARMGRVQPAMQRTVLRAIGSSRELKLETGENKNCHVFLDNDGIDRGCPPSLTVSAGPHLLTVRSPCCATEPVEVSASQTTARIPTSYLPARYTIITSPEDAEVAWRTEDKSGTRSGGQEFSVTVDKRNGKARLHVDVSAPGYQTQSADYNVNCGETRQRTIELDRNR